LSGRNRSIESYALIFAALAAIAVVVLRLMPSPFTGTVDESIAHELFSGERLIWSGLPQQGFRIRIADAVLIPFSLLWGGFAIFWERAVLSPRFQGGGAHSDFPQLAAVWGLAFVFIGLYLIFGRFFVDAWMRSRTLLAVTDRRIIILTRIFTTRVMSLQLGSLGELTLQENSAGRGTISFGRNPSSSPMVWPGSTGGTRRMAPAFEGVERVREVYGLIQAAMQAASKQRST
jgi:hypothetical protein